LAEVFAVAAETRVKDGNADALAFEAGCVPAIHAEKCEVRWAIENRPSGRERLATPSGCNPAGEQHEDERAAVAHGQTNRVRGMDVR
jgi:hypothetical protein